MMDELMNVHRGWDQSSTWSPGSEIVLWLIVAACGYVVWFLSDALPRDLLAEFYVLLFHAVIRAIGRKWIGISGINVMERGVWGMDARDNLILFGRWR